jgi:Skp family chaperone for outer membrane proteins
MATLKAVNPEERLQKSVARDIKLRQLEEHSKRQAEAVSLARWESKLLQKDDTANRKRMEEQISSDSKVVKVTNTSYRREKLQELYRYDELRYEAELNDRGLAFRHERL